VAVVRPALPASTSWVASLNADSLDGIDSSGFWKLGGNAVGTTGVLGTTNEHALVLKVNGQAGLKLLPDATSPDFVGGFYGNAVLDGAHGATIGGGGESGYTNRVSDHFATVGGGEDNQAGRADGNPGSTYAATVAGGYANTASGLNSALGGGYRNVASSAWSTVAGGIFNVAGGSESAVAGGGHNKASGPASTVAGGFENTAGGEYSFAAGTQANATDYGSFVWADGVTDVQEQNLAIGSYGEHVHGPDDRRRPLHLRDRPEHRRSHGRHRAGRRRRLVVEPVRPGGQAGLPPVDRSRLLSRLARVPISSWSYKSQQPSIRHLGPTAQDFRAAFGLGEDARHIDTIDSEGVALAAIQGLYRQNQALQRQNRALNARLTRLERAVAKLSH
jgi:hypothetical protein